MKTKEMTDFLDNFSKEIFGKSRTEAMNSDTCVTCGGEAYPFRDALSAKEFKISGMCQKCQDKVFGG